MMNAAAGIFLAARRNRKPTARSYVQDGLIAMWDGIENAGWGVHDSSATVWHNLGSLGSTYDASREDGTFADNAAQFVRTSNTRNTFAIPAYFMRDQMKDEWSLEVVFTPGRLWFQNYSGIFGNHDGSTKGYVFGQYENGTVNFNLYAPGVRCYQISASTFVAGQTYCISQAASNNARSVITWRDGVEVAVAKPRRVGVDLNFSGDPRTCIGAAYRLREQDIQGTDRSFDGLVHSVRVYSRALTAAEIAANRAVDKARFNLP